MSNWITNCLTLHGDTDVIAEIVNSHFQIEPHTDPDRLPDMCVFRGLIDDPDKFDFGFQTAMGTTAENANGWPATPWDGAITNPFFIFWLSKWGQMLEVPELLLAQYPNIKLEYGWYDLTNEEGQRCESENGTLFVKKEWGMVNKSVSGSKLMWEDGRVFVPPEVECTWRHNDDGTLCRSEQYSGFWIYQDDLKYTHPDNIGENVEAHLTKDSFHDESKWDVWLHTPHKYKTANANLPPSDPESKDIAELLAKLNSPIRKQTETPSSE